MWWNYFALKRHSRFLPELDGLRGMAILLVILRHASNPFMVDADFYHAKWHFFDFVRNGTVGVDLFFVLSGFLITNSIIRLRQRGGSIYIPIYFAKRALRIFPAYYCVLFMVVAGLFPYYVVHYPQEISLAWRTFYHTIFMQDYTGNNIVVTFWSLGVEEKFYILIPLVLYLITKLNKIQYKYMALVFLIICGPLIRYLTHLAHPLIEHTQLFLSTTFMPLFYYPFHTCLDPLFMGVLCAFIYQQSANISWCHNRKIMNYLFGISLIVAIAMLSSHVIFSSLTIIDIVWQRFIFSLCFGGILLSLVMGFGARTFFQSKWLMYLAIISYSLYLIHMPLQPVILKGLQAVFAFDSLSIAMKCLIFYPIFILISIIAALLLHYLVEKPFYILKDKL